MPLFRSSGLRKKIASIVQVRDAIDKSDFETFSMLCEYNWELYKGGFDYVIETKPLDFLIEFIKKTKDTNTYTLAALYDKGSMAIIEKVFEEIEFSQKELLLAASQPEIACSIENFFDLLNRMKTSKDQESAVSIGINTLFQVERTDHIDPLLAALKRKDFLSGHLRNIAIQRAFFESAWSYNDFWPKRFYNHPAITSDVYAKGLVASSEYVEDSPIFLWLLAKADRNDLQAAKGMIHSASHNPDLRACY